MFFATSLAAPIAFDPISGPLQAIAMSYCRPVLMLANLAVEQFKAPMAVLPKFPISKILPASLLGLCNFLLFLEFLLLTTSKRHIPHERHASSIPVASSGGRDV